MAKKKQVEQVSSLALLPLRDVVVYPHMVLPLFVGRAKSIAALDAAIENDETVFLLAQRNPNEEDPQASDLHEMGTVANVLQVLKLPDGTVKVLAEGVSSWRVASRPVNAGFQYFFTNKNRLYYIIIFISFI